MEKEFFGCYSSFYGNPYGYLGLLNLGKSNECLDSIKILRDISRYDPWEYDSIRLISDNNWRSQIGPAISYLSQSRSIDSINNAIWDAVKRGSWISPQLLAVLSLTDDSFMDHAILLVESGVTPVHADALTLHSETGPGNNSTRFGKICNALLGLYPEFSTGPHGDVLQGYAENDMDNANGIASEWKADIIKLITDSA